MGWIKRIFSNRRSRESEQAQPQAICRNDQSYYSNSDIVEGVQFSATLQIRTPLFVLKRHGEVFKGPPSQAPQYGSQADGIWVLKTKTFRGLGVSVDEPEFTHSSDAGPIEPSQYLPFLIQFRSVVESDSAHEKKLEQLASLAEQSAQFKEIWNKLSKNYDDFPVSFFYMPFAEIPGVGRQLAKRLYESGFRSVDEIINASVLQLIAVPGLGDATAEKIKAMHFPRAGSDAC